MTNVLPADPASDFLTVGAVARVLNPSESTVRKYERLGILPAVRTSTNVRIFRRQDVERLKLELRDGRA